MWIFVLLQLLPKKLSIEGHLLGRGRRRVGEVCHWHFHKDQAGTYTKSAYPMYVCMYEYMFGCASCNVRINFLHINILYLVEFYFDLCMYVCLYILTIPSKLWLRMCMYVCIRKYVCMCRTWLGIGTVMTLIWTPLWPHWVYDFLRRSIPECNPSYRWTEATYIHI